MTEPNKSPRDAAVSLTNEAILNLSLLTTDRTMPVAEGITAVQAQATLAVAAALLSLAQAIDQLLDQVTAETAPTPVLDPRGSDVEWIARQQEIGAKPCFTCGHPLRQHMRLKHDQVACRACELNCTLEQAARDGQAVADGH